jgi:hypothetical protein
MHSQVSQYLAIEAHIGLLQAMDEATIAQTVLAAGGIDASNPQTTKVSLTSATIPIRVHQGMRHRFVCGFKQSMTSAKMAFRQFQNFLVPGASSHAAFYTCHWNLSFIQMIAFVAGVFALLDCIRDYFFFFR